MDEQKEKIVEKHYIEVSPSPIKRFFVGLAGGIGWGVGLSIGTGFVLYMIGIFATKVDLVPIFGSFLADVIKSAQTQLPAR